MTKAELVEKIHAKAGLPTKAKAEEALDAVVASLREALADGEGNLKEMLAAPDGVHLSAGNGYGAWVTYLRNHAKYSADNSWTMGSAYSTQ